MATGHQIKQTVRSTHASAATVPAIACKQQTHHQAITELGPKPVLTLSASVVSLPKAGPHRPRVQQQCEGPGRAPAAVSAYQKRCNKLVINTHNKGFFSRNRFQAFFAYSSVNKPKTTSPSK
ncbi:hypothetical protein TH61_03720 [Rufibacter sp. DG15C]|uniref:hypothetical protein n=1 Tax=Rufibacter sp. DG15C TaxID=1379909 RepID=UPI00078CF7AF|nr:hypothetical protein [Rufibacter sp. DG15C]AMM50471.1 hypothetical protein TH61_03720 [Rufibacter sp. DG15C]